jgi:hypothetical protein
MTLLIGSSNGRRFDGKVGRTPAHCVSADQCPFSETRAAKRCDEREQTRGMNLTPTSRSTVAENIRIVMIAVKSIE